MKQLRIHRQVGAPARLPSEPVLRAPRIILESQEVAYASRALCSRLNPEPIPRRDHH
jgi:hypothetical protein